VETVTSAAAGPASALTRSRISPAALFVKVRRRMDSGATPSARRRATRQVSVRVFPDPAPAMTRTGPSPASTTAICWPLRSPS
jgi:hypothetical protein